MRILAKNINYKKNDCSDSSQNSLVGNRTSFIRKGRKNEIFKAEHNIKI